MASSRVRGLLPLITGVLLGGLLLALGGCDLPSEPPHVVLDPEVRTPLLAEQGFVALGPDDTERTPLIDTTRAGFDSLFAVNPSDQTIFLTQAFAPLNDDLLRAADTPLVRNVSPDRDGDDRLDLADNREAQRVPSGLESLGGFDIEELDLRDPSLTLTAHTNVATDAVVYLALLGERGDDEAFLAGRGPLAVSPDDTMRTRLVRDESPIPPHHLMRIPIEGASSPDAPATHTVVLDTETATVDAFMERLPERLRFIGTMLLLPDGMPFDVPDPLRLDLELGVDVPLDLARRATITHTMDTDLSVLEAMARKDKGTSIDSMALQLRYENGMPLGLDLHLDVLDDDDALLTQLPDASQASWVLPPAPANGTVADRIVTPLTRADLQTLSEGQRIRLQLTLRPNESTTVRLRATDAAQISLHGHFELRVQVGK